MSHPRANMADVFDRISDAYIELNKEWQFTYVNKKAASSTKRNQESLIGSNIWTEFPQAVGSAIYKTLVTAMQEQKAATVTDFFAPMDLWVEIDVYPLPDGISVYASDISDKKIAEEKILKANRLYYFVSHVTQMIVRVTSEEMLYREVCKIAINIGKFSMAWVGLIDPETKNVVPVVHAGNEDGYLSKINSISVNDIPEGRGPTGTALREGKYVYCNDIANDPNMAPWREEALSRGYYSSISLPIRKFGEVIGAFTMYASVINYFNKDEIDLLRETTADISFAVENLHREEMRKKVQQELAESEQKYRAFFENSMDGILLTASGGKILAANTAACKIFGMTEEQLYAGRLNALVDPDNPQLIRSLEEGGHNERITGEFTMVRSSREKFPAEISSSAFKDAKGEEKKSMIIRDITGRKRSENEILEINSQLRLLSDYLQKIREEERTAIAREIHDELGQQLTVMKMDVSWLAKNAGKTDPVIQQRTEDLKKMLDQTVMTVRRIASELRPSMLDDMGLGAAIEWQLGEFTKRSGVNAKFENGVPEESIPGFVKTALFRIVQESLTNVARHANAEHVQVCLSITNDQLLLSIRDDGEGFDQLKVVAKKTLGILGMKERATMLGGTYEIQHAPEKGTVVLVKIPLTEQTRNPGLG